MLPTTVACSARATNVRRSLLALPDEALRLRLLEEGEESRGVLQIFGDDVTQCWGLVVVALMFPFLVCKHQKRVRWRRVLCAGVVGMVWVSPPVERVSGV